MHVPANVMLDAVGVRRRVFDGLAPVGKLAEWFMATSGADRRALRYVVQLHPLVVQVTLAPDEGRPARRLHAFEGAALPDRGAALGAAVECAAAAVMAGMPEDTAAAVTANAATIEDGGLFVMADPIDELVLLALAGPGGSLGEGDVLGAIVDDQARRERIDERRAPAASPRKRIPVGSRARLPATAAQCLFRRVPKVTATRVTGGTLLRHRPGKQ